MTRVVRTLRVAAFALALACAVSVDAVADESTAAALVAQAKELHSRDSAGARALLDRALTFPADPALRADIMRKRCWWTAYDDAAAALALADRDIETVAGSGLAVADLRVCRGYALEGSGRKAESLADYDFGAVEGQRLGDREIEATAVLLRGQLRYENGEFAGALADLERSYALQVALGNTADQRAALTAIANVYADERVGDYERALEYYGQGMAASEAADDNRSVATAHFNIGSTLQKQNDFAGALPHPEKSVELDSARGDEDAVAFDRRALGILLGKMDRLPQALAQLDESAAYYARAKDADGTASVQLSRGTVLRRMGRLPEAQAELEAARVFFDGQGNLRFLLKVHEERALAAGAAGQWQRANDARTAQLDTEKALAAKARADQTSRLRVQFESAKKEQENRVLQGENATRAQALADAGRIRNLQTALIAAALAILAGLAFLVAKLRGKNAALHAANAKLAESREEVVRNSRKAELIFNALNDALAGTVLDDKYGIEQVIGSGGFGTVYRATQVLLGTPVAIKVLKPVHGQDAKQALERFRLEGVSAFRVTHPNAVRVLDFGVSMDAVPYLAMELLDGRPLSVLIEAGTRFAPERVAAILAPVCGALAQAHAAGIVHRDVKPSNILLCSDGSGGETVKLIDFGIAKVVGEEAGHEQKNLTGTGLLIGTPNYMAPERFLEMRPDGKVDVYSVGIVAYEMLAGHRPFADSSENYMQVVMQHLHEPPPSLALAVPETPRVLLDLVESCLAKTPRDRPDAQTLADALRRLTAELATPA